MFSQPFQSLGSTLRAVIVEHLPCRAKELEASSCTCLSECVNKSVLRSEQSNLSSWGI